MVALLQWKSICFEAKAKARRVRDLTRAKESRKAMLETKARAKAKAMTLARARVQAKAKARANRRARVVFNSRSPRSTLTLVLIVGRVDIGSVTVISEKLTSNRSEL